MKIYLKTSNYISSAKKNKQKPTDNMIRVRSSNVYSYAYQPGNNRDLGTLYIQFKDEFGRPGDIYRYYDVPTRVFRRFISGPSKGHSFWKLIRNKYQYSKLTGDKRGKLKNAIN